ncbi:integrase arm-type DNA-binding domain-containing protein [Piscinibacter sp. Jin2]|uniref:Integrase arm-type DNA-binding domain-containing protein n=1 Tax=Aquariibacter lacus TaxID=2801332 RepID=A0A9X0XHX6_9BURK|nr:site-specific integrase [Piscinibacter lacus]MBL0720268.1 integrase arm-type DNA-binding domain-containing protein [Piscinibacter lacus]
MPKMARELYAVDLKRLTKPGRHLVGVVPGLALQVAETGARSWVLRIMVGARRREIGLGSFPAVTLAMARQRAAVERDKVRQGCDPVEERRVSQQALRAQQLASISFQEAATQFIESRRGAWRNAKSERQWTSSLTQYAYPLIGSLNVGQISRPHILAVLEQAVPVSRRASEGYKGTGRLWEARAETASRLRGRMESILDWCKGRGYCSGDNPAAWDGNLAAVLPDPTKMKRVTHHPAVALDNLPRFWNDLGKCEGIAARALEFLTLTAARSGEVRGMLWTEVSGLSASGAMWIIPASRMKAGREHRVPLSKAARDLLNSLPRFEGCDLVFPGMRGGPLSDMSLSAVMRRMGRVEVPHGLRSSFRDWVAERTTYPGELAEAALAHSLSSKVEAAYRRMDMLEKRRAMMEDWATHLVSDTPVDIMLANSKITSS